MPKQIALPFDDDSDTIEDEVQLPMEAPSVVPHTLSHPIYVNGSHHSQGDSHFAESLLAIASVRGIGPKTLRHLIDTFNPLQSIWSAELSYLTEVLYGAKLSDAPKLAALILDTQTELRKTGRQMLRHLEIDRISLIDRHHPAFPTQLASIPDAPYWLFAEGNLEVLQTALIGIVGTRKPSESGLHAAERLTAAICREGFGIVSGLAEGIDATAHRVGLYYRAPQVAVLGTGIDVIFPAQTRIFREKLLATGGVIISEYFPGDTYSRAQFVQRNRLQAALSVAVCPVESQAQSGTAHTLRFARSYGRPVFGVRLSQVAEQNEILGVLAEHGYPVFDIAERPSVKELFLWLRNMLPADGWPRERRQVDTRWFFDDIFRQIDDVLAETPISYDDQVWLREELIQRIMPPSSMRDQEAA